MSKEKTVRIGIIGSGFARTTQIPGFLFCPQTEVVSIASRTLENAAQTAREFNIPHFTDDWRETVRREDIDLISIVTPPVLHCEQTLFALEHGKHVLCEKPTAMTADEARKMTEKAQEKGLLALIDHELRFLNGRRKAFAMIQAGEIGEIRHAKYRFCNSGRGKAELPWTWWNDVNSGGGALGAIGSHVIDSFRWFLQTEIAAVFCRLQTHIKERPFGAKGEMKAVTSDDETLMILRFAASGIAPEATASVSISVVEAGEYRNTIEFFGSKGAIRIEDGGEIFLTDFTENIWKPIECELGEVAPKMRVGGWSRGFVNFAREIVEAVRTGKTEIEHAANFADGLKIQEVLDAARKSDATGTMVII